MSRKVMVGGEEKGDWFDAVISWASPAKAKAKPPVPAPAPPPEPAPAPRPSTRKPKEEVVKAARAIKTREQLMPTSGPSEPHTVVPEPEPVHVEEPVKTDERPARSRSSRVLGYHPCGHLSWATPESDEAARAEGLCCGNWSHPPNWEVRGLRIPLPENQRRTVARLNGGWPGLCYDPATGLYIGGAANDCRTHGGGARCPLHSVPRAVGSGEESEAGKIPRTREKPTP